ncbi:carbohydrate ABC transporter permease [Paenibacillus sp. PAMC21692]|uniref:carbohydrate ABC transporter permease n=1 Tax=Paenibacillus sp. PAMC21692 TaxID=2762320 RepID=UPI00164D02C3|nr:carbohydrate ABC transporter permease [Paenibacillus sp. PAMC21692]QNK56143.1 carbohydrate ABC transporter permease [Paenibacillus sp. PAMC21692]
MVRKRRNPTDIAIEVGLFLFACLLLYPIYFLYVGSFKSPAIFYDPFAFPKELYWGSFAIVFEKVKLLDGFFNTLVIMSFSLVSIVVICSMAGYAIARVKNRWFQAIYYLFLSGMIVPLQTTMVTIFKMGVSIQLIDTRTFMVLLYAAGAIPIATFIYVGFMKSIPKEIEESAFIDGCGPLQSFARIVLPLLLPATGTILITNVTAIYNDFMGPLLYLKSESKMTLMPQIVQFYANKHSMDYGPVFALSALAVLPLILLFIFTQKYMIKGLIVGSLKG